MQIDVSNFDLCRKRASVGRWCKADSLNIGVRSSGNEEGQIVVVERRTDVNKAIPGDHNFGGKLFRTPMLLSNASAADEQRKDEGKELLHTRLYSRPAIPDGRLTQKGVHFGGRPFYALTSGELGGFLDFG